MDFYSNLPVNLQQPTLFEILSVNEVKKLIKPTLRYIFSLYLQHRGTGRWLLKIFNKFDLLILLLKSLLEYRHCKATGATILDKFYGLKRVSRFDHLTFLGVWINDCLSEYINDICEQYHEKLQSMKLTNLKLNNWQQWFDLYFPKVQQAIKVINFCFKLKYLRDSKHSDLVQFATQTRYERYSEPDEVESKVPAVSDIVQRRRKRTNMPRILEIVKKSVDKTSSMFLDKLFPSFLVMIRILQIINQRPELFKQDVRIKKPKPPVLPSKKGSDKDVDKANATTENCPLCGEKIKDPAMISSGYIADLKCAEEWVRTETTCFITGIEINKTIRKLLI
ncbi:peroxisome assembly protein 12 [Kluyveromyces marxianus]|nr:peroxisome assembly protein 12 [Kluyveromyces marxianus]